MCTLKMDGADGLPHAGLADKAAIDRLALPAVEPPLALVGYLHTFDSIVSWYGANRAEFRQTAHNLGLPVEFLKALPDVESREHAVDFFARRAACRPDPWAAPGGPQPPDAPADPRKASPRRPQRSRAPPASAP